MPEDNEEFISLTLRTRSSKKPLRKQEQIGNNNGSSHALQDICKKSKHGETRSKTNDFESEFACILEASESTRLRMDESLPKYHEDHIAVKGDTSLQHYNLVHKFIPMPQAIKNPEQKQQWLKNGTH